MPIFRSPRPRAAQAGDAAVLDVSTSALWVPGLISRLDVAVEGLERGRGAEDRIRHLHLEGGEQVVAVAAEDLVVAHLDLEVQVAVRAARRTDLALRRQLQPQAGVDAGRDVDRDVRRARTRPWPWQVGHGFGMTVP